MPRPGIMWRITFPGDKQLLEWKQPRLPQAQQVSANRPPQQRLASVPAWFVGAVVLRQPFIQPGRNVACYVGDDEMRVFVKDDAHSLFAGVAQDRDVVDVVAADEEAAHLDGLPLVLRLERRKAPIGGED